jgi:hypothetical protein
VKIFDYVKEADRERGQTYSAPWVGVWHEVCEDSARCWAYRGDIDASPFTDLAWLIELADKHVCPKPEVADRAA